jgi:hypothetical protein
MFVEGLSPSLRSALERVAVLRRFDDPFLRFMLSDDFDVEILDELKHLPFVTTSSEGYTIHDVVREILSKNISFTDPEKYRKFKKNAWLYLIKKIQSKDRDELWKSTADLLYLIENPVIRDAFFPRGFMNLAIETAKKDDAKAIIDIAEQNEPTEGVNIIKLWWQNYPEAFRVVRNFINEVEGFFIFIDIALVDRKVLNDDPVTKSWYKHLDENPLRDKDRTLFLRRWLSKDFGEMPCTPQGACFLDVKRNYMELRPHLKRMYLTINDLETYKPVLITLGFKLVESFDVVVGDLKYHTAVLDFGTDSVDGWLKRLIGIELGIENLETQ